MATDVYEAIATRRTIRDFNDRLIARDVLLRILDAGLKAPSHNHLREWHFVVVDDPHQRARLVRFFHKEWTKDDLEAWMDECGMEDERQRAMYADGVPKQTAMVLDAGALVIPCFRQRGPLLGEKRSLHELNAFASIWAVIENVLIAAASEGIQGVTKIVSTPKERDHIRKTLGVREEYEIPCYLLVGYPAGDAVWNEQIPINVEERFHMNRWNSPKGDQGGT